MLSQKYDYDTVNIVKLSKWNNEIKSIVEAIAKECYSFKIVVIIQGDMVYEDEDMVIHNTMEEFYEYNCGSPTTLITCALNELNRLLRIEVKQTKDC